MILDLFLFEGRAKRVVKIDTGMTAKGNRGAVGRKMMATGVGCAKEFVWGRGRDPVLSRRMVFTPKHAVVTLFGVSTPPNTRYFFCLLERFG